MKYLFLATTAIALLSITVYAGKVKDTKFKHGRGFFDAPFDEIITTETPGATIIYTFDVSDPRHSENTVMWHESDHGGHQPGQHHKTPQNPGCDRACLCQKSGNGADQYGYPDLYFC